MHSITTPITEIEDLLRSTMGLDPNSYGRDGVHRAIRLRAEECGLKDLAAYAERVRESPEELQALIEVVVVSETWFFRHIEAFQALTDWVQTEWLSKLHPRSLRILSAPCSTGEEPYSVAMMLLDACFPSGNVSIDAIDISRSALAQAAQGRYRENSFRSAHLLFRDRYFTRKDGVYHISEEIRKMVRFRPENLMSPDFNAGRDGYDVIFCRNVLIYFGHDKQRQAIAALTRLLAPSGVLFVGPAEGCLMMEAGFAAIPQRMSFGFQRRVEAPALPAPPKMKPREVATPRRLVPVKTIEVLTRPIAPDSKNTKAPIAVPKTDLAIAREHADAGRLPEAEAVCNRILGSMEVSADVYALLGVVQDALGRANDAEASYRRAIYLDPAHHQALIHLASLADSRNDSLTSKRLRDRARRSEERR